MKNLASWLDIRGFPQLRSVLASSVLLAVFLASTVLALLPLRAHATTMSPTRFELDADPGTTTSVTIKVYNDETTARDYVLSSAKFESQGENGDPLFVPEDRSGLISWFEFPARINIAAKQHKEVEVKINVPADAKPGGYFAAIFASVLPPPGQDAGAVALQSDTGVLVLFRVNGEFPIDDALVEFDTKEGRNWFSNLPVEFFFRFRNAGADRAQPLGDITIRNTFGGLTKIVTANKGAGNVLPQTVRRFDSAWVTAGGKGDIEGHTGVVEYPQFKGFWSHVQYEWNNFAFGRYTAHVNLTVNNDASRSHSATIAFWVIPWHLIVTILGVIAAERLLGWLWRKRKRLFNRKSE